jgi:PAS domain S-box-containing protein
MAYSLAMSSSDGSSFPPLTRDWNTRESEQLRISHLQGNHMRSSSRTSEYNKNGIISNDHRPTPYKRSKIFHNNGGEPRSRKESLPRTLEDALRPTSRAIVVTETMKPFRVFNVNKAWEDLCGYKYIESKGESLGTLLKGEETDPLAVTALINQLLRGEEASAVITNYTKDGRKFRNRLHVGPLYGNVNNDGAPKASGNPAYFVGVLEEV